MFDLKGKKAIVTGASRKTGICFNMAKALKEEGAEVILLGGSEERIAETIKSVGGNASGYYGIAADLTKKNEMKASFEKALDIFNGKIDILINGAGTQYRSKAVDFPSEKWEHIININLSSMFYLCQLVGKVMIEQGHGKIINIASMNAFLGGSNVVAYASSKGGVVQMTKALSNEWMPLGINVNSIAPGFISTELSQDLRESKLGKEITKRIPAKRWGDVNELAGAAVFLASPASNYISGIVLPIDGGYLAN